MSSVRQPCRDERRRPRRVHGDESARPSVAGQRLQRGRRYAAIASGSIRRAELTASVGAKRHGRARAATRFDQDRAVVSTGRDMDDATALEERMGNEHSRRRLRCLVSRSLEQALNARERRPS